MNLELKSLTIKDIPFEPNLSKVVGSLYDNFNKEKFDEEVEVPIELTEFVELMYDIHGQDKPTIYPMEYEQIDFVPSYDDVVIAYSGGLDSLYLALKYKEIGKTVHLFHVRGLNKFSAAYECKATRDVAEKYGFDLIEVGCSKAKKDSPYHQFWSENPMKNQLIESLIIDYCAENGYSYVTSGYEHNCQNRTIGKIGYNVTDWKETTETFDTCILKLCNDLKIEYLLDKNTMKKADELKEIAEKNALGDYFSCTDQIRFVNMHRTNCEKKYQFKMPIRGCGLCRKCMCHLIGLDRKGVITLPEQYKKDSIHKLKTKFKVEAASYLRELDEE